MRHDTDVFSLVSGLTFTGLGLAFLLRLTAGFSMEMRWVWPSLLIAVGVAVLVTSRPR